MTSDISVLYHIMDQGLLDRNGERCGRVDDIEVEDGFDRPARIIALISGQGALSRSLWPPLHRLSMWIHEWLGQSRPVEPSVIRWKEVNHIDFDVILKRSAEEAGLDRLNRAVANRFLKHIPGAER